MIQQLQVFCFFDWDIAYLQQKWWMFYGGVRLPMSNCPIIQQDEGTIGGEMKGNGDELLETP